MPSQRIVLLSIFACIAAFGCTEETRPPGGVGPSGPGSTGANTNTGGDGGEGGMGGDGASGAGAAGAGGPTIYSATFADVAGSNLMETSFSVNWMSITINNQATGVEVMGVIEDTMCSIILTTALGGMLTEGATYTMSSPVDLSVEEPAAGEGLLSYRKICGSSFSEWRSTGGMATVDQYDGTSLFFTFDMLPMAVGTVVTPNDATGTFSATGSATNLTLP